MRRPATTLIALIASAALLAGCTGGDGTQDDPAPSDTTDTTTEPNADDVAALEAVVVTGDTGSEPTLSFDQPFTVSAPVARVDVEGDGETLEEGRGVELAYLALSGDDGSLLESTWQNGTTPSLTVGDTQVVAALNEVLTGQKVGVRVLFAAPGFEGQPATDTTEAIDPVPATLMAIEVTGLVPTRAEGTPVTPPEGLPVVTLADDGRPSIEIPAGAEEPTELVAQTLIEGDGAEVQVGQTVTFNYSGWLWDGTPFDSSWDRSSAFESPIGVGRVIAGWDEGLVGKTLGSQVLLVVPADKGYGDTGQGSIPGGATLVFVVDLLAAS